MKITGFIDEIDRDFAAETDIAKELAMDFIELRSVNGRNISELSLAEVYSIKEILQEKQLMVSSIASPIGKEDIAAGDFERHFLKFRHIMEIARILNVSYIRIFSFLVKKEDKPHYENEVFRRIRRFLTEAEKTGITLLHENEKGIYGDDAESCLKLAETMNHPKFKLIFDAANFVQVGESPLAAFKKLAPYIEYIHLKDACFNSADNVLIASGDGQIPELLALLINKDYQGFLSLEPHLTNFRLLATLEPAGITGRKHNFKDGKEAFVKTFYTLTEILTKLKNKTI